MKLWRHLNLYFCLHSALKLMKHFWVVLRSVILGKYYCHPHFISKESKTWIKWLVQGHTVRSCAFPYVFYPFPVPFFFPGPPCPFLCLFCALFLSPRHILFWCWPVILCWLMINSIDINSYPYKSLKCDLSQRGLNTVKRVVVIVVVVFILLFHRFQGVTLEYVVIDSPKITAVIYWAHIVSWAL